MKENETSLKTNIRVNDENLRESIISQSEGLKSLHAFLFRGADFSTIKPFMLDLHLKKPIEKERNNVYTFYLGKRGDKRFDFYLTIPIPKESASKVDQIYVRPGSLMKGKKPYYWLEFYSDNFNEKSEKNNNSFASCWLKPWDSNKIDFKHWHGIGEQLFADYLLQENEIKFGDLSPFEIEVKNKGSLGIYKIGGRKGLDLHLGENSLIEEGDRLKFTPQQDDQRLYQWTDLLKVDQDMIWEKVASYRMFSETHTLTAVGWFGPEKQLLIDYLLQDKRIQFENLRPIKVKIPPRGNAVDLVQSRFRDIYITLSFQTKTLEPGVDGIIIPRQDKQKRYQWLELYKYDSSTEAPQGECIVSARIFNKKIIQHGWNGPEIEFLRDYTKGQVTYENLRPISFKVKKSPVITLWKDEEGRVYFAPSLHFGLSDGETVTLVPKSLNKKINLEIGDFKETVEFILMKGDISLGRYEFYPSTRKFYLLDVLYSIITLKEREKQEHVIPPEEADEMMRRLLEDE